ncbi:MAG: hypothetical protein HY586_03745 [Candidatus Omnitrophica bacterium]|nr:hypothetical protein [Candidatus Omnitrophota bacterium]
MSYYHDLVTQKSWEELGRLRHLSNFVLIGGWAVYLYTRSLKSKDIDIIINFEQLPVLEKHYRLVKNERLKKYEAIREEVQIDIYLPHYSTLGIDVSILQKETLALEGFTLLDPDYLTTLKLYVLSKRARSAKGEKDFIDLISLIHSGRVNLTTVSHLVRLHGLTGSLPVFFEILREHLDISELAMKQHAYSKIKKQILSSLRVDTVQAGGDAF